MSRADYRSYIGWFVAACFAFLAIGSVAVLALDGMGRLPAPPLTATNCIDEKFQNMREAAPENPDLIAVGSSATWRNLDFGSVDPAEIRVSQPYNAAPCFLQVSQTNYLTDFYLDNMPSVSTVLTVFAMRDFKECPDDGAFFDRRLAGAYVYDGLPALPIYFVNFRPRTFFKDVMNVKRMRSGPDQKFTLVMDRFGSGPLEIDQHEIQTDVTVDPKCLPHLARMEQDLAARGKRWIVVLMPAMPAWLDAYDPGGKRDRAWRQALKDTLKLDNTIVLDGAEGPLTETRFFTDPNHFHWRYVPTFTRWIFDRASAEPVMHAAARG